MPSYTIESFTDFLRGLGRRPGFYLAPDKAGGCESISHLRSFITGFQVGQHLKDDSSILGHFTFWVCHRYGVSDGGMDWSGHILERADGDEAVAFRLFFELFEQYLEEREKIGPEAIQARFVAMLAQMHKDWDKTDRAGSDQAEDK
jgi:hypothetical protein